MPSSLDNVMQTADIETTDANIQSVGASNSAGTSTKLAAADHVHSGSGGDPGYEIVTGTHSTGGLTTDVQLTSSGEVPVQISVAAPTGKKVVGGGYTLATGTWPSPGGSNAGKTWGIAFAVSAGSTGMEASGLYQNGPASDGSSWEFSAILTADALSNEEGERSINTTNVPGGTVIVTVYAICIAA